MEYKMSLHTGVFQSNIIPESRDVTFIYLFVYAKQLIFRLVNIYLNLNNVSTRAYPRSKLREGGVSYGHLCYSL